MNPTKFKSVCNLLKTKGYIVLDDSGLSEDEISYIQSHASENGIDLSLQFHENEFQKEKRWYDEYNLEMVNKAEEILCNDYIRTYQEIDEMEGFKKRISTTEYGL